MNRRPLQGQPRQGCRAGLSGRPAGECEEGRAPTLDEAEAQFEAAAVARVGGPCIVTSGKVAKPNFRSTWVVCRSRAASSWTAVLHSPRLKGLSDTFLSEVLHPPAHPAGFVMPGLVQPCAGHDGPTNGGIRWRVWPSGRRCSRPGGSRARRSSGSGWGRRWC